MQRVLPATMIVTFVLVPSTATSIFKTFLCDAFEYDATVTRRWLHDDLALECNSDEYEATRETAYIMLLLWPVGVPLLYVLLLAARPDVSRSDSLSPLRRAKAFLSDDYKDGNGWWEVIEMNRKLILTGWVLVVEHAEQARALAALLISILFVVLHLFFKPLKRCGRASRSAPLRLSPGGLRKHGER